jgi:hypothetical protein
MKNSKQINEINWTTENFKTNRLIARHWAYALSAARTESCVPGKIFQETPTTLIRSDYTDPIFDRLGYMQYELKRLAYYIQAMA